MIFVCFIVYSPFPRPCVRTLTVEIRKILDSKFVEKFLIQPKRIPNPPTFVVNSIPPGGNTKTRDSGKKCPKTGQSLSLWGLCETLRTPPNKAPKHTA